MDSKKDVNNNNFTLKEEEPEVCFGMCADIQYANKDDDDIHFRFYRSSLPQFQEIAKNWNKISEERKKNDQKLDFCIQLGDIIDGWYDENESPDVLEKKSKEDLKKCTDIAKQVKVPFYHVLGNHCHYGLTREYLLEQLGLKQNYYSFLIKNWKFIILDGTEVSTYGHSKENPLYKQAENYLKENAKEVWASDWNSGISQKQIEWLKNELSEAKNMKQKILLFNHHPFLETSASSTHLLWNHSEILEIIENEKYENTILGIFFGHYHKGGSDFKKGILYLTLKAVLSSKENENAHCLVKCFRNRIEIQGFGQIESQSFFFD